MPGVGTIPRYCDVAPAAFSPPARARAKISPDSRPSVPITNSLTLIAFDVAKANLVTNSVVNSE